MFQFANSHNLYLLIIIPIFVGIYIYNTYQHRKKMMILGEYDLINNLTDDMSSRRRNIKFSLTMFSLFLVILILSRPQFGTRNTDEEKNGIEIIVATDVSNSMLCRDVSPSRLDKAKMILGKLIGRFENDRIGLVAFAGSAITVLPITSDYVSAKIYLSQFSTEMINSQGTNIAEAIKCSISSFSSRKDIGKALIIITDSEDHEDGAIEMAENAKSLGINVFVLSVGTPQGGTIPLPDGKTKLDNNGCEVITKLNKEIGEEIAKAGDGVYMNIDNSIEAEQQIEKELTKLKHATYHTSAFSESNEQFIVLSIILFIISIVEVCITEKKNSTYNLFKQMK